MQSPSRSSHAAKFQKTKARAYLFNSYKLWLESMIANSLRAKTHLETLLNLS